LDQEFGNTRRRRNEELLVSNVVLRLLPASYNLLWIDMATAIYCFSNKVRKGENPEFEP
jgi:hypothetical protein